MMPIRFRRIVWLMLCLGLPPGLARGQTGATVSTLIRSTPTNRDGTGTEARFTLPHRLVVEPGGDVIVTDLGGNRIRRITPAAVVTTIVGDLSSPRGLAVDASGNTYFTQFSNTAITRLTPAGALEDYTPTPQAGVLGGPIAFGPGGDLFAADITGLYRVNASRVSTRYAGGGTKSSFTAPEIDGPLGVGTVGFIEGMCFDPSGTLYIAQRDNVIRKVVADGTVTTVAGVSGASGNADGAGTAARFSSPFGLACDASGNVIIADLNNHAIRRMAADGAVTTIAGTPGTSGYTDGPAASARFFQPRDVAVTSTGDVFVADGSNAVIRKISGGVVSTFAGFAPNLATGAFMDLVRPRGLAIDAFAGIHLTDAGSHTVWRMSPGDNPSIVMGGKANVAGSADGFIMQTATFAQPYDVEVDSTGVMYLLEQTAIRRIAPDGATTTFAGSHSTPAQIDGTGTAARFVMGRAMAIDSAGNLYVADSCAVRKVTPGAVVTTLAGAIICGHADGTGSAARFSVIADIAVGADGTIFTAGNGTVRSVSPAGLVTTVASSLAFEIVGIGVDASGTIYVSSPTTIRRVAPDGTVTTIAGEEGSFGTADGVGGSARFGFLRRIAIDAAGNVVAGDRRAVRLVTPSGTVSSIARPRCCAYDVYIGTIVSSGVIYLWEGSATFSIRTIDPASAAVSTVFSHVGSLSPLASRVDGVAFASARFNAPSGLALGSDGTEFVADTGNHTIRRVAGNVVSTLAGSAGASGSADGSGGAARFSAPQGLAMDAAGTLLVADTGNDAIRRVTAAGVVTTVATGFSAPKGVAADAAGNIYVADAGSHTIKIISAGGSVTTLAGSAGVPGSDDGTGAGARFSSPSGVAVGPAGVIYVADTGNHTLRAVTTSGVVTTIAGLPGSPGLVDGIGSAARLNRLEAVAVDSGGALFAADTGNGAVRLALIGGTAPVITANPISRSGELHASFQFTCGATGTPAPAYSWETATAGGTTTSIITDNLLFSGSNTSTLTLLDFRPFQDGVRIRCVARNAVGTATSSLATLTFLGFTLSPQQGLAFGATGPAGAPIAMTPPQTVHVTWRGSGAREWSVASDRTWIQVSNATGSGTGQFTVAVTDPGASSDPFGRVTFTSGTEPDLTRILNILFIRKPSGAVPTGVFDTPANNATGVQGSIAVTGWALDDVEMDHVEIWRDPMAGETTPVFAGSGPGNGKIFIGNAIFVAGARPDIENAYALSYPGTTAAGWGYMLLTQGLWNQGNGTYTLYAFAFDKTGAFSTIGTKTITVDNANATKPFGAIDTPGQGATASGIIENFGWALTPGSSCSIANPSVRVSIDSGPLTPVVYGDARSDIAGAFPTHANAAAAGGHYTLDTTTLANGLHTIGWYVTDNCGRSDGVGSRFFTVANSSFVAASSPVGPNVRWGARPVMTRVVRIGQNERVEVPLPGDEPYRAGPLPIGSSFDPATNTFMWQPAAGFLGAYDLEFFPPEGGSHMNSVGGSHNSPVSLRVVVGPPIRMVIDTPKAGNVLNASGFTIAGWAVDLGSIDGAGVDTLHLWAYPVGGGPSTGSGQAPPVFVGVAKSGGARPDVARLYGASFGDAGFTLTGALAPGTYDLVVFAHSAATNTFAGAETVRVIVR